MWKLVLFLSGFTLVSCYVNYNPDGYYYENDKYCDDLSPSFGELDLDQISGVWYGVEKIPHTRGGEYRVDHTSKCFYIDIKELHIMPTPTPTPYPIGLGSNPYTNNPYSNRPFGYTEPYRMREFVLEWHEGVWQDDYHLKVNTSHRGFWPSDVPNNSVDKMYRFFGGVIQVLKVANNHLVLHFCMRLPHAQVFSVILSRNENQLTAEDLASIHNVFTIKHLSTSSMQRVLCENSAASLMVSSFMFLVSCGFVWFNSL